MSRPVAFSADHGAFAALVAGAREIRVVAPGLDAPRADTLARAARRGADVRVVLDPAEATERHGLGALSAVDRLREAGAEVRHSPSVAIGLVLADGAGYLHFARSRLFADDGACLDAVHADPVTAARLVRAFFPPRHAAEARATAAAVEAALGDAAALRQAADADAPVADIRPLDDRRLAEARDALHRNPPRDPDLTRRLEVYTRTLQFVEITLRGGTFDERTVSLPPDLLLGVSTELRALLRTRLRVFETKGLPSVAAFQAFKREVGRLRDESTTYVPSRKKWIFASASKQALLDRVAGLRRHIKPLVGEMAADVLQAIRTTERMLEQEVARLLTKHPPESYGVFRDDAAACKAMAEHDARGIVSRIRFPKPAEVLGRIELAVHFYDLTWEDFDDEAFIRELHDAGVIDHISADELRHLRSAFEAKLPPPP